MGLSDTHDLAGHRLIDAAKVADGFSGGLVVFLTDGALFPLLGGAAEDGRDIRFSADEAGEEELPRHVLTFSASGAAGIVAVRVGSASASVDTPIYFWAGKTGNEEAPAATDPNGRNAVFADFEAVWSGHELSDLSGKGHGLNLRGSAAVGVAGGPLGAYFRLPGGPGPNDFLASGLSLGGAVSDLYVYRRDIAGTSMSLGELFANNGRTGDILWTAASAANIIKAIRVGGSAAETASLPAAGAWGFAAAVRGPGGGGTAYNGSSVDKGTGGSGAATFTGAAIGSYDGGLPLTGGVAIRAVAPRALTDGQIDTISAAWSDPEAFTKAADQPAAASIAGAAVTDVSGVIQRAADGWAPIALAGSYANVAPVRVEARYQPGGDWTEIDASPASGAWSGTLAVPAGGPFSIEVRLDSSGTAAGAATGVLVGMLVLAVGQSNVERWNLGVTERTLANGAGRVVRRADASRWQGASGAGEAAFLDELSRLAGMPVGLLNFGKGSASILEAHKYQPDLFWWDHADPANRSSFYEAARAAAAAHGFEAILHIGGHGDGGDSDGRHEEIPAALSAMFDDLREAGGAVGAPAIVYRLLRFTANNPKMSLTRAALETHIAADGGSHAMASVQTLPMGDAAHAEVGEAGCGRMAALAARAVAAHALGIAVQWRGPVISAAVAVDGTHTDVRLTHQGGADIAPASGITGFEVSEDGTNWTGAAGVRLGANSIRLTHAQLSAAPVVRYQYGLADVSGAAFDENGFAVEPGMVLAGEASALPQPRAGRTRRISREDRVTEIGAG